MRNWYLMAAVAMPIAAPNAVADGVALDGDQNINGASYDCSAVAKAVRIARVSRP